MLFLKQSTAYTAKIGPFIDDTDGKTAETGLTLSQADIRLSKNGGDFAQKNESTAATHDELGYYDCPLDTTDTGTLGKLQLVVHESGALPVFHEFMVVTANIYDSLCSTDKLEVDVAQWLGQACAAVTNNGVPEVDVTHWLGTAAATPTEAGVPEVDVTYWKGAAAQAMTGDAFARLGAPAGASVSADVAAIKSDTAAILTDTGTTLDGKIDTIDGIVDAILVDTGTTLDGNITAIKAKTDNLPADPADQSAVEAAISALNDIAAADVLAETIEGAFDVTEAMRLILAAVAGFSSGGGTVTFIMKNTANNKDRITSTVDGDGNRTGMVYDVT